MKKLLLSAFYCCLAATAFAQKIADKNSVKGMVTDSITNKPLGYVTLTLKDSVTKRLTKSGLTKDNGIFQFNGLPVKSYQLSVASVGYRSKSIVIPASAWNNVQAADLGTIELSATTSELKGISITAAKPLIKQEIDRLSYDVQADGDSKGLTVMEILRKVPLITVDGDDNIQLQGSGSYRIFINGKSSALMTNNPKDVLRSMPANSVQRIEVITTPPAKYDSEGLAGIINIITTKKTADGYSGTATARYNFPWGPGAYLNGTYKKGKFGISVSFGEGNQLKTISGRSNYRETFAPYASRFSQQGDRSNKGNNVYGSAELSYEIDTLNLLTAAINYNKGHYNSYSDYFTQFSSQSAGAVPQRYNLLNDESYGYKGTDLSLNYQLGFKRNKNQLLTGSYRYSGYQNKDYSNIATVNQLNYTAPDYNQQNDAGTREHTLQLDYVQPVGKLTVEAGAKGIFRNNFSESAAQNRMMLNGESTFADDPSRRNNFTYHQNVLSLYNSYTYQLTSFTVKAGARLEHTHVDADFATSGSSLDMNYFNVVPSLSLQRRFKYNQSLTLGYTNRLERPGIYQLNPFVDRSNPQIISSGNPALRPVLSYLLELNYSKAGNNTFNIKASYFYTGNAIQYVTRLLSDTLSENTYANVGTNRIARLDFNDNLPIGKKLNFTLNTNIFYVWISGYVNSIYYQNQGPRTNTFGSLSYKPADGWQLGLSGGYNRRYITLQGSSKDYAYSYFNAAKSLFEKKLTLTGTLTNPFQKRYAFTQYSSTDQFYQSNTNNSYYRGFNLSLVYKFGGLNSDIKKNKRSISNDDKTSSSNN
ncbi:MAG: outer membrane beta-barrel protein [Janthinobacterium lividum]